MRTAHKSVSICLGDSLQTHATEVPSSQLKVKYLKMISLLPLLALLGAVVSEVYGDCQIGWVRHGSSCYHISRDHVTWEDAYTFCKIIGGNANGYLVEIDDYNEVVFIENQVKLIHDDTWIGATDLVYEGEYIWMTSKTPVRTAHWSNGQPDNAGTNEDCVEILADGTWNDQPCSTLKRYICEETIDS